MTELEAKVREAIANHVGGHEEVTAFLKGARSREKLQKHLAEALPGEQSKDLNEAIDRYVKSLRPKPTPKPKQPKDPPMDATVAPTEGSEVKEPEKEAILGRGTMPLPPAVPPALPRDKGEAMAQVGAELAWLGWHMREIWKKRNRELKAELAPLIVRKRRLNDKLMTIFKEGYSGSYADLRREMGPREVEYRRDPKDDYYMLVVRADTKEVVDRFYAGRDEPLTPEEVEERRRVHDECYGRDYYYDGGEPDDQGDGYILEDLVD